MPGPRPPERGARTQRWLRPAGAALVYLLAAAFSLAVPPGEAPDEPAHLDYLDSLLSSCALPSYRPDDRTLSYEAHQPPLDYLALAGVAAAIGVGPVRYPFRADPNLDFGRPGSRAFLPATPGAATSRRFRVVRLIRAIAAPLTFLILIGVASDLRPVAPAVELAAAASVALAPQFLFVSATVNNDGGVTALAALDLLLLLRLVRAERPSPRLGLAAGGVAALALAAKGTGLCLAAPLLYVAMLVGRRTRKSSPVLALLAPWLVGVGALLALQWVRFGALRPPFPAVPGHDVPASALRLLRQPHWVATLWSSFWARFGWFDLPLPAWAYLAFLPTTAAVALGLSVAWRSAGGGTERERTAARVAALTLGANLAVVLGFMVGVAWQPQGRLLFPSLAALGLLAAIGARRACRWLGGERPARLARVAAAGVIAAMLAADLYSLQLIRIVYR